MNVNGKVVDEYGTNPTWPNEREDAFYARVEGEPPTPAMRKAHIELSIPRLIANLEAYQKLPIEKQDWLSLDAPELAWVIEGLRLLEEKKKWGAR